MGFFNILETFFFISLAITFVLIMMLVYHFKGRISILEQKCDTMFEIMNNMVKEMRTIKTYSSNHINPPVIVPNNETMLFQQRQNLGELFQHFNQEYDQGDEDDDDEDDDEDDGEDENTNTNQKIVVSDTECEDGEPSIKVINIEFSDPESNIQNENLEELEELEEQDIDMEQELEEENLEEENLEAEVETSLNEYLEQSPDYKKMEMSHLKTLIISRSLATASDVKKMKKGDLIKVLEDSKE